MPTRIEWATEVYNPVTGCTPVSAGCEHCYARRMATRLRGRFGYPQDDPFKVTLHPDRVDEYLDLPKNHPYGWKKPRMVFCCSMGDFFHPQVPLEFQARVLNVMVKCPQHIFIILTKREEQLASFNRACGWSKKAYPNIWLGISAEDQPNLDRRIIELLKVDAAKRIVSIEPMLGAVNLHSQQDWLPTLIPSTKTKLFSYRNNFILTIDWVICGGETGPGARPMHPDWPRQVKDQCVEAGVPFFFKSWGEWAIEHPENYCRLSKRRFSHDSVGLLPDGSEYDPRQPDQFQVTTSLFRIGKEKAGRLLDGKVWEQVPG